MTAISDAAREMGLLIDDLLSFSRMNRHPVKAQQVDPGRLVRDILLNSNLISNALKYTSHEKRPPSKSDRSPTRVPKQWYLFATTGWGESD